MKLPRWDRIYFFVFTATVFAVAAFGALFVFPMVVIENAETSEQIIITLLEDGQSRLLWLSLLPVVLAGSALLVVPKSGLPDRPAKINLWISTILIYVFVVLFMSLIGILFIPTAIIMTAASVGAQVRRRKRTVFAKSPQESKSGRGGGKRNRNKG